MATTRDLTLPCPPLPVITRNYSTKADQEAANEHFKCVVLKETGGMWTTDQFHDYQTRARNWIYGQMAKYAVLTPAGEEQVARTLQTNASYTPPAISTAPRILTPAPTPSPASSPARAIDNTLKTNPTPVQPIGAPSMKTSYATLGGAVGSLVPGVGTIAGGGLGALTDFLTGAGKSKCPGPYNYNPMTGGCDPKPGSFAPQTPNCPAGSTWDASTGQCKVGGVKGAVQRGLPGGATGYVDPTGWTPTSAFGLQGFLPQSVPSARLSCPAGYVLYGKEPGMEVCLPKGFLANKHRKWPKPPRPAMSAQDVKTLNRINAIQRKVSNMTVKAGFKKPVKK